MLALIRDIPTQDLVAVRFDRMGEGAYSPPRQVDALSMSQVLLSRPTSRVTSAGVTVVLSETTTRTWLEVPPVASDADRRVRQRPPMDARRSRSHDSGMRSLRFFAANAR